MIDLHCHILPAIDDGPKTEDEAIEMARIAVADGITDIVATPHSHNGFYYNKTADVMLAVVAFTKALQEAQIPLRIHSGSEVHIHLDLISNIQSLDSMLISDHRKYILLELPVVRLPRFTEELLEQLRQRGITPIIAHPERILMFQDQPELLANWIERYRVVAQLTASSLIGCMGKELQKTATFMLEHGLGHVIASDAHDCKKRKPLLKEAYQYIHTHAPKQAANYLNNARAILHGEQLSLEDPRVPVRRKKWFFF